MVGDADQQGRTVGQAAQHAVGVGADDQQAAVDHKEGDAGDNCGPDHDAGALFLGAVAFGHGGGDDQAGKHQAAVDIARLIHLDEGAAEDVRGVGGLRRSDGGDEALGNDDQHQDEQDRGHVLADAVHQVALIERQDQDDHEIDGHGDPDGEVRQERLNGDLVGDGRGTREVRQDDHEQAHEQEHEIVEPFADGAADAHEAFTGAAADDERDQRDDDLTQCDSQQGDGPLRAGGGTDAGGEDQVAGPKEHGERGKAVDQRVPKLVFHIFPSLSLCLLVEFFCHPLQGRFQDAARAGQVHALKADAFRTKIRALIHDDAGVMQPFFQLFMRGDHLREVQPLQVRGLHVEDSDLRQVLRHKVFHEFMVLPHIGDALVKPRIPFFVSGLYGDVSQCRQVEDAVGLQASGHAVFPVFPEDDQVGGLHAGRAERLAGRHTDDQVIAVPLIQAPHRDLAGARHDQVRVDLVREEKKTVFQADIRHPGQILFGPYMAGRIVRVAQQDHAVVWIRGQFLKAVKVDRKRPVRAVERARDGRAAVQCGSAFEPPEDRGEEDHAFAGLCELLNGAEDAGKGTGGGQDPLGLRLPAVAPFLPAADGVKIPFGLPAVAERVRIEVVVQGFQDAGGVFEFHVGHGERDGVPGKIRVILLHLHVFKGPAVAPVDERFKIVGHGSLRSDGYRGNLHAGALRKRGHLIGGACGVRCGEVLRVHVVHGAEFGDVGQQDRGHRDIAHGQAGFGK